MQLLIHMHILDLQVGNLSVSSGGLVTWNPPTIITSDIYQNLMPLGSYEIRYSEMIGVHATKT